ncbi:MAG: NUDIX domain-containing protein [Elusimicrobia bacterium]|nr:NUDIX domain-containing protein [Candidatus Obscuribacterium magneticum]MCB4755866.1 NUDIX domain-containing protein [Candidatus Obscuribacterium magneticum]
MTPIAGCVTIPSVKKTTLTRRDFSCGGVVWDEDKKEVLMIRVENLAKKIVWTFPKGHPDKGESTREAALREVREETGWACKLIKPLMDVHYMYVRDKVRISKIVRWFLMKPLKKVGDFDKKEILEIKWCPLEEARLSVTYKTDKDLLLELKRVTRPRG